jgi:hypothetical protein
MNIPLNFRCFGLNVFSKDCPLNSLQNPVKRLLPKHNWKAISDQQHYIPKKYTFKHLFFTKQLFLFFLLNSFQAILKQVSYVFSCALSNRAKERSSDKFARFQWPVILKNNLKSLIPLLSRTTYYRKDPLQQSFGVWKIEKYFSSMWIINLDPYKLCIYLNRIKILMNLYGRSWKRELGRTDKMVCSNRFTVCWKSIRSIDRVFHGLQNYVFSFSICNQRVTQN